MLYEIDPAPFKAALDNAAANLDVMRKTADRARAALAASLASVTRQKATLDLARTNRQRLEDLLKDKAVSASDRDQAVTDADVAEATLQTAEAQVDSDRQAVAAAEAAIKQAEAALETARINLAYTRITAPISGRIGKSTVTDGAIVTAYQPAALATIQQLDPIYVDVPQSTAELMRLKRRLEGGRPQPRRSGPEQGQAHPGRRHHVPLGRDASIPRRHGGPDDRVRHSAGRLSQSERASPAGHVRPGGGEGRRQ